MSILAKFQAFTPSYVPAPELPLPKQSIASAQVQRLRDKLVSGSVEWSPDLARVLALPRREKPDCEALAEELTLRLKTPNGAMKLRPIQAWALWEGAQVGGLLGNICVGAGKELIGLLMPLVMPSCRRAVLLIPPSLRAQLLEFDWQRYGEHWQLPNLAGGSRFTPGKPVLHIVAYSELSSPKSTKLLEQIQPDVIIANECHLLKARNVAKTRRFLRYYAEHHMTRFCGWSGTITSNSLRDYAHLSALALGEQSPLPLQPATVDEWAAALDPSPRGDTLDAGQLRTLCKPGEAPRAGFRRRFVDTAGVVATAENELGTSLVFHERAGIQMPSEVTEHLRKLRKPPEQGGWVRPDGEEFVDALRVNACARELAAGFYYRWKFPKGEPEELILDWFEKRQGWNRELRKKLEQAQAYLDSPKLCATAARRFYEGDCPGCKRGPLESHERGCKEAESHPLWPSQTWPAWGAIENAVYHESEAMWVSDFAVQAAADWAKEAPGIVWVEHDAFGKRLAHISKMPYYGGGVDAALSIMNEPGTRSVIASMKAHGTGRNLQAFNRNLITSMPSDAALVEQVVGRTHRSGQRADEVEVWLFRHTDELRDALIRARTKARYIQDTTGSSQKLCYAAWTMA